MCYVCPIHENMTQNPDRKQLERMLELERLPWYGQGVHGPDNAIIPERKADMDEYNGIQRSLAAHYPALKKGDRILVIGFEDRNRKVSRKAMLDGLKDPNRKPKPRVIFEATVHSPVGHRVKKNQWVGDGYEDVKVSTFSYAEGGFIITPYDSASMAMVKI